jgi:hypothetical protein
LVKLYLDSALNDPKSYQNIKFSNLDTVFTTYTGDPTWIKLDNQKDSIDQAFSDFKIKNPDYDGTDLLSPARVKYFTNVLQNHTNKTVAIIKLQKKIEGNYKKQVAYWIIKNQFRAKNAFGALGINQATFQIDTSFSKILDAKNN